MYFYLVSFSDFIISTCITSHTNLHPVCFKHSYVNVSCKKKISLQFHSQCFFFSIPNFCIYASNPINDCYRCILLYPSWFVCFFFFFVLASSPIVCVCVCRILCIYKFWILVFLKHPSSQQIKLSFFSIKNFLLILCLCLCVCLYVCV